MWNEVYILKPLLPFYRKSSHPLHSHLLSIKTLNDYGSREYDEDATCTYFEGMTDLVEKGISFAGKVALVTGCGVGSIAVELVKSLLAGGKVITLIISYWFYSWLIYIFLS